MARIETGKKQKTCFLKVKCSGCGNEQIIFSAAATPIKCLACNQPLAKTGASRITPIAKVVKELW
ncbi:MAG: 30S ribosomal protein S27e [Candidatus Diapherotrites archaeon]|uniref:30S ribosomal protein S27e n=1 Tax=Candidatus Iainarchaeum sp. TaxID=3101447 RepID=A0A938YRK1_9ARCH|nr:30S ribosomal protein S27e [Candidatus Diapherotrites archaeon]